jgi:hypothetical protein
VLRQIVEWQQPSTGGDTADRGAAGRLSHRIHGRASLAGHPFGLRLDTAGELPLPREPGLPAR